MQGGSELYTVIFLVLAIFVFFRLRSVLGQRKGYEQTPEQIRPRAKKISANIPNSDADNLVVLPLPKSNEPQTPQDRWKGYATEGSPLAEAFDAIAAKDKTFNPADFINGAKIGYEMIITAFAHGDRKTLTQLLSKDVFESFLVAIMEREEKGEKADTKLIGFDEATVREAQLRGHIAEVTVKFATKLISFTTNKEGAVIDGSSEALTNVTDVWTFARDTRAKDPNWKVIRTEEA